MDSDTLALIAIIFEAIMIVVAACYAEFLAEKAGCFKTAKLMGVESSYSIWTSCMIKVNNTIIPLDNYRYFGDIE